MQAPWWQTTVLLRWVWCDSIWSQLWWGKNWWWISYVNFRKGKKKKIKLGVLSIKQCLKVMPQDQWGGLRFIGVRAPWMIYRSDKKWNIFLRWVHVDVWMYETKTSGKVRWGNQEAASWRRYWLARSTWNLDHSHLAAPTWPRPESQVECLQRPRDWGC